MVSLLGDMAVSVLGFWVRPRPRYEDLNPPRAHSSYKAPWRKQPVLRTECWRGSDRAPISTAPPFSLTYPPGSIERSRVELQTVNRESETPWRIAHCPWAVLAQETCCELALIRGHLCRGPGQPGALIMSTLSAWNGHLNRRVSCHCGTPLKPIATRQRGKQSWAVWQCC